MKNKLLFVGFALALCLIQLSSCHKKMCVEEHGEVYEYQVPEVRDTLIQNRIIYFAGEKKLQDNKLPDPQKPVRRVLFRNYLQLPMTDSGIVKLYLEINETGVVTYAETLPETTITTGNTLKKIIKAAFGYKYEANYNLPAQASILTINLDITK